MKTMDKMVRFTKMHGAGNDYIYVDTTRYDIPDPSAASIAWSRYHTGIGSDGLVLIGNPDEGVDADFSMRIFNADGSEAMMCGNASRCIGKYVYEKGLTTKTSVRLQTLSGVKTLHLHIGTDGSVESVTVDMLMPAFHVPEQYDETAGDTLTAAFRTFRGTFVSMGNPHLSALLTTSSRSTSLVSAPFWRMMRLFRRDATLSLPRLCLTVPSVQECGSVAAASLWHAEPALALQQWLPSLRKGRHAVLPSSWMAAH